MQTVSLREFQLHAAKYLDKLPILLTRYNMVVAQVLPNGSGAISEKQLHEEYKETSEPIIIKDKKDVKKILEKKSEEPFEHKAFGWCQFVSKEGRRCTKMAVVETNRGCFCEDHG